MYGIGGYATSGKHVQLVPELIWDLCSGPLSPEEQLDRKQSLARQARLVDFVLDFDAAKMCTPALQNDFSRYRRAIGLDRCSVECYPIHLETLYPGFNTKIAHANQYTSPIPRIFLRNRCQVFHAHCNLIAC
ncbi:unnamed protein product [Cylicocyclus nassatus]|uniref:CYRIA/CYRIB Rac1 binding domain-containing protein n=1 Tax=Cylicocyclus nassatus TaxID=53992 RepID=A0AA36H507_CYLNA|nr:unnamed protein product [Cylicocyclus nassatus]